MYKKTYKLPNYLFKSLEIYKKAPTKPGIYHVYIRHDSWCDHFKGKPCNCDPDVSGPVKDGEQN